MSPSSPTVKPSMRPLALRMVMRSSSPWVGCSCAPSPALMIEAFTCWASRCGAPGVGWRTTITSAPMASMFLAVSMKVSPLERLEALVEKSCVSAESRFAARLKLVRVRVEFSKKRLKTMRPCSAGTFLRLRGRDFRHLLGRVEDGQDLGGGKVLESQQVFPGPGCQRANGGGNRVRTRTGARARRWCDGHGAGLLSGWGRAGRSQDVNDFFHGIHRVEPNSHAIAASGRQVQPHKVGLDRQFSMATIHQHGEANPSRPTEIADFVDAPRERFAR